MISISIMLCIFLKTKITNGNLNHQIMSRYMNDESSEGSFFWIFLN